MNKPAAYLLELRAPFLTASLVPVVLGTCWARHRGSPINWGSFALLLAGFALLHLGTNVLNDYWDHRNGTDEINREYVFPFSGGSRLIQQGLLSAREVAREGYLLLSLGAALGLFLAARTGPWVAAVWTVALASGLFYTAPPFYWAHRGWGELLVVLNFGPLAALTASQVQTRVFSWPLLLVSAPIGLLAGAILFVNQFPDYPADLAAGKRNWVVRLGRARARWVYGIGLGMTFAALLGDLAFGLLPGRAWWLFALLPVGGLAAWDVWRFAEQPRRLARACGLTIGLHALLGIGLIVVLGF